MQKRAAYQVRVPKSCAWEFMSHDFYIGMGHRAQKVANYWNGATQGEKYHLLKTAQEMGTDDLAEAYDNAMERKDDASEEE